MITNVLPHFYGSQCIYIFIHHIHGSTKEEKKQANLQQKPKNESITQQT